MSKNIDGSWKVGYRELLLNWICGRSALFWDVVKRVVAITSTRCVNDHYSLRNNPEEYCSYLLRSGSLKSCMDIWEFR